MLLFRLCRDLLWLLSRVVISLRYRVRIHGAEQLTGRRGPVLVLPNHPSYSDPVLVLSAVWPALRPRPMLYEGNFRNPFLFTLAKLLRAVPVPDLQYASVQARERTEESVAVVMNGLRKGENFVLWPTGHVQHDGVERLGEHRAAADILRAVPETEVVLVRTRGLWGSMFSFAYTGKRPRLIRNLCKAIGLLFANLLVFMPRRPVDITIERVEALAGCRSPAERRSTPGSRPGTTPQDRSRGRLCPITSFSDPARTSSLKSPAWSEPI